jgi:glycosyltransferase involved in cell wall biosynthesis
VRIVAIIAAYNEERFIGGCLDHLHAQGVESYLCDNGSTDATVELASRHLARGLIAIESVPRDGVYRWQAILERKEALAEEIEADWFLHLDADEIPLPPPGRATLREAVAEADAAGYNAIEFSELTFVPTREAPDHDHPDFRSTMVWYYPFASTPQHLLRGWKRQNGRVDLATTGGHAVRFAGCRPSPRRFRLRHYLFLSREHAREKYERRRYDAGELRRGWHGWRPSLRVDSLRLPSQAELRVAHADDELDESSPRTEHCVVWTR